MKEVGSKKKLRIKIPSMLPCSAIFQQICELKAKYSIDNQEDEFSFGEIGKKIAKASEKVKEMVYFPTKI